MPPRPPESAGILTLLDHGYSLRTPDFQRSYAWERRNVKDFWGDLKRALDHSSGPEDYFLGLIVLDEEDELQDGQQRLATTLLIASEIYRVIEEVKEESDTFDEELAINALSEVSAALRTSPTAPLTIGLADQDELLGRTGVTSQLPESRRRLRGARSYLRQQLALDIAGRDSADAKLSRLRQWGSFLRSEAYVVVLRVRARQAHSIFETVNTRGVRLSNGDLVKSHLIATATDTGRALAKWGEVIGALRSPGGEYEKDLESFLLHYYGSRYGETKKTELFSDLRGHLEGQDSLAVLDALIESARIYRALVDPQEQSSYWSTIGPGTQQAVALLNGLGLKQVRYAFLAVLRDFANARPPAARRSARAEAIVRISSWSVRSLVSHRTGGGQAMKAYIAAATAMRREENPVQTAAELEAVFDERSFILVDDDLFKSAFMTYRFDHTTNHTKARAILYALEYSVTDDRAGMQPGDALSVEHVLPRSPEPGQWTEFTADERRQYTYELGNLLLIDYPSGANNALGNKEWPEKKALIESWSDQTPLTIAALNYEVWNIATINERSERLADLAVQAWPA